MSDSKRQDEFTKAMGGLGDKNGIDVQTIFENTMNNIDKKETPPPSSLWNFKEIRNGKKEE